MSGRLPADVFWLLGATFLLVLLLAGTLVPLYAALFYRPTEASTVLERWLVRFGNGLLALAMVVVGAFAVGFALTVFARVWRIA